MSDLVFHVTDISDDVVEICASDDGLHVEVNGPGNWYQFTPQEARRFSTALQQIACEVASPEKPEARK